MTAPSLDPLRISTRGTTFIEASAGTGKTYALTSLYVRMLLEGRGDRTPLSVQQILVVTFTEAATAELRLRIRERLHKLHGAIAVRGLTGEPDMDRLLASRQDSRDADLRTLTAALHEFDEAGIFTIHGFCQRILRENAFESGVPFDVALVTTQVALVGEIVRDFWVREMASAPEVLVHFAREQGVCIRKLEGLARRVLAHRRVRVLPEFTASTSVAMEASLDRWRSARAAVGRLWERHATEILTLLCTSRALNRSVYRESAIRGRWATTITALLCSESATWTKPTWFKWLTTEGVAAKTKKECQPPSSPFFGACSVLSEAESVLREAMGTHLVRLRVAFVEFLRKELRQRKAAANVHYFDDLVHGLEAALDRPGSGPTLAATIRERFPVALIDEFQDTDPSQFAIFDKVYAGRAETRMLVGDPKQAIYTFRGADVFAYLAARDQVPAAPHRLATNRRSAPDLVRAINTLFGRRRQPFGPDIAFEDATPARSSSALDGSGRLPPPLQILFVERPADAEALNRTESDALVTAPIAAEITHLLAERLRLGDRPLGPGDIAVLCRTNRQAAAMQAALRHLRVPSVLQSAGTVFASAEATEVQRIVTALADPANGNVVRAALVTDAIGVTAPELLRFDSDPEEWDAWLVRWRQWHDLWCRLGFLPAFRRLLDDTAAAPRLLGFPDGERRLTNVLHLGELLHRAEAEVQGGPERLDEWLRAQRQDADAFGERADDAAQMRLESDADAVKLVTVHKSKGLEYPVVFCPYLWDASYWRDDDKDAPRFHDEKGRLCIDVGSSERGGNVQLAQSESMQESMRLLYVALTRARERCVLVWGAFRGSAASPLAQIFHDVVAPDPAESTLGDDAALLADLHELAGAAPGAIAVEVLRPRPPALYTPLAAAEAKLACRTTTRRVRVARAIASFSGFVDAPRAQANEVERDHDSVDDAAPDPGGAAVLVQDAVPLAAFPRGTRTGQMVHRIFERLDFPAATETTVAEVVRDELAVEGIEASWQQPLAGAIGTVLDTRLSIPVPAPGETVVLRDLSSERCLKEMEFVFPLGPRAAAAALTPQRLGEVFEHHAASLPDPAVATTTRELGFGEVRGFLRGFIDLVFEHGGRWYIVDWKTNSLGPYPNDYRTARLREAMRRHHYYLQYHLYVVALHKYLRFRVPTYDYARHFGGVLYLFLRGMGAPAPAGAGVFWDRPAPALVEELSAVLGDATGGGAT